MEMNEAYEFTIERAFDIDALSLFMCGVREIDQLIHKIEGDMSGNTIPMYKYLGPSE